MVNAVLTVACPDRKGLIAAVANFIYHNNGNILSLDEFVDPQTKQFFMRLEWDLRGFLIPAKELYANIYDFTRKKNYAGLWQVFFSDQKSKMAVFVSKYDHCLYDLLLRHRSGELNCEIPLIISNHPDLKYVADTFKVDFTHIPVTEKNKLKAEQKALELLKKYQIDFIVLARYMQILSGKLIKEYENKIINIHHSFLPAFKGAKPYEQAYEHGVKIIGATSHFVTEKLDQGPIIQQGVANISHKDNVADLITKGRDLERQVLAQAVRAFIDHRLFVSGNRTIIL